MNTEAIDRIEGYCCEVDEEQWKELVRVADDVKFAVYEESRRKGTDEDECFAQMDRHDKDLCLFYSEEGNELIPYPDFLAKMKGEEKWEPKAGEMVEVSFNKRVEWEDARFIGLDHEKNTDWHVCYIPRLNEYHAFCDKLIRPARPTITRTEAEQLLNKRIID
jgi:hypothetical protein